MAGLVVRPSNKTLLLGIVDVHDNILASHSIRVTYKRYYRRGTFTSSMLTTFTRCGVGEVSAGEMRKEE